jgi:hypothetical protein
METDVVFQDGDNCSRTASGTTTFTNRSITVAPITVSEDLCLNDLRNKWTQILLRQGTMEGKQVMPEEIAAIYFEEKSKKWLQATDVADWQGDTASGTVNLQRYDGWIKLIDAGSPVNGNTGGITVATGVTAAHYVSQDGDTLYYGTTMRLRPTYGLRTLDRAFITYPTNLVIGMDGENDGDFEYRLDPVTNKKILVDADWTRGTQVFFTEQVVEFTLVP